MSGLSDRVLGDFVVKEKIGEGGYGAVYRAEQRQLARAAVIKVLHARHQTSDQAGQRFLREALLASRLDHPYAAHLYAFGVEPDGLRWIAMELVRGTTLAAFISARGKLTPDQLVPLFDRICEVVHTAHEHGIIHRDLKPANVMVVTRAGRLLPKLLDFGIAKGPGDAADPARGESPTDEATITQRGAQVGSPAYMAPEQWTNSEVTRRTDLYALGILAFEALTGKLPFTGSLVAVARAHAAAPPPPTGHAAIDAVLARALAKDPLARFASALELAAALRSAAGLDADVEGLPRLDAGAQRLAVTMPRPVAETVSSLDAARSVFQARELVLEAVRVLVRYVGLVALACRARGGGAGDVPGGLRVLRERPLSVAEWLGLVAELVRPFAERRAAHPIPELVDAFAAGVPAALARLAEADAPVTSEPRARERVAETLAGLGAALDELAFLAEYPLVVPGGEGAALWMGARRVRPPALPGEVEAPAGRPILADWTGRPVVALWPLVQVAPPSPGTPDELFLFAGGGPRGARLVAAPLGYELGDDAVWDWLREQILDTAETGTEPGSETGPPYRGLAPFTRENAALFFGREREVDRVVNRLRSQPLVALVGPSGAGKSSFVEAGVVPALGESWRCVSLRPGARPMAALERALAEAPALLFVDQLEEVFTLCHDEDERRRFARALLAVPPEVRVLLALRDDFLMRAESLLPRLGHALQLLGTPRPEELERILVEPARRAGYQFEDPGLVARMVAEVKDLPGALPLLSFTASRLWDLRDRHFRRLPRTAYEALGGVGGALAQHAEALVGQLGTEERRLLREAFRQLVTAEGTRAVIGRAALVQSLGGGEVVIDKLLEARLIVSSESGDVEIIHEALLAAWPRLVAWRQEDAEGARLRDQLRAAARQWDERHRPDGLLWRGDALAELRLWRARQPGPLADVESAFTAASEGAARRSRRWRVGGLAAAFVLLGGAVTVLLGANRSVTRSQAVAKQRLVESYEEQGRQYMLAGDYLRGLVYLSEAYREGADGPGLRYLLARGLTALDRQRAILSHEGWVFTARFSPDGRRVVTGSEDHTARLWDVGTGKLLQTLRHDGAVPGAEFSPDGRLVATASWDGTARLWDAESGAERLRLAGHGARVHGVAFAPDGGRALTWSMDRTGRVWDVATGRALVTLAGHERGVVSAAWSRDGAHIVTASNDATVRLWESASGRALAVLRAGDSIATSVELSPDGQSFLAAMGSRAVVWRIDGVEQARLDHTHPITHARFSPDGARIVTDCDDGVARTWDAATGRLLLTMIGHGGPVRAVAFSPDGTELVTGADREADLWDARSGKQLAAYQGHGAEIWDVVFAPDGTRVVTSSNDLSARIWDAGASRVRRSIEAHAGGLWTAQYTPDGGGLAAIGADGSLRTWRSDGSRPGSLSLGAGGLGSFHPDGRRFVDAVLGGTTARLWDLSTGQVVREFSGHTDQVIVAALRADGARMATASADGTVRVWDVESGRTLITLPLPEGAVVRWVTWSHDGTRLATAGDRAWRLWDAGSGALVREVRGDTTFFAAVYAHDDRSLALITGARRVELRDAATGDLLRSLEGHTGDVNAVTFSPDDQLVATGGDDETERIWEASSGKLLEILVGHTRRVQSAAFDPSGAELATVAEDDTLKLWNVRGETRSPGEIEQLVRCRVPFGLRDGLLLPARDLRTEPDTSYCLTGSPRPRE